MSLLYEFNPITTEDIMATLAKNLQRRRLEKGWSRNVLAHHSNVPAATIAKFEQKHSVSLASFVAMAKALGYTESIISLLSAPIFNTMEELDTINRNKHRKRGRNEISK